MGKSRAEATSNRPWRERVRVDDLVLQIGEGARELGQALTGLL